MRKDETFRSFPCNLCGSQENLERVRIKKMLNEWQRAFPGRVENIFRSLQNISPSQLVDRNLFDFSSIDPNGSEEKTDSEGAN